jgi:hypothetical protein
MNAHIYNARNKMFQLIITSGASISEGVISTHLFASKKECKAHAKLLGAKAWNY